MNILDKVIQKLKDCDKTPKDVEYVEVKGELLSWKAFCKGNYKKYQEWMELPGSLLIIWGKDWWIEHYKYEYMYWWKFEIRIDDIVRIGETDKGLHFMYTNGRLSSIAKVHIPDSI